jgi:hypothetical protein
MKWENRDYRNVDVQVDNNEYFRCSFKDCNFIYMGGPFSFIECEITLSSDKTLNLSIGDAAQRTIQFFQLLASQPHLLKATRGFLEMVVLNQGKPSHERRH